MARLLPLLFLFTLTGLRADEWWAWSSMDLWKSAQGQDKAWLFLGNRLDADDSSYVQIVSPRFRHALNSWLDLGLGASFLSIESPASGERHGQFRPELEVNPHFDLTPHLTLEWRNRMEWRWNEEQPFTTHRLRNRLQLAWTLPRPLGPLTRVFASNEWLTDLHQRRLGENRLVPLGLTLHAGRHADLDLFYMIMSSHAQPSWRHESVFGTYLRLKF